MTGKRKKGKKVAYRMRRNRVGGLSQPGVPRGNAIVCMCLRECVCSDFTVRKVHLL